MVSMPPENDKQPKSLVVMFNRSFVISSKTLIDYYNRSILQVKYVTFHLKPEPQPPEIKYFYFFFFGDYLERKKRCFQFVCNQFINQNGVVGVLNFLIVEKITTETFEMVPAIELKFSSSPKWYN